MGILDGIESIKYRPVIDLIKTDEAYDKKRNTVTGLETLELMHKRFLKFMNILLPLKEKIGKDIEILDIDFGQGMQEDITIAIKYNKGDKSYYLSFSNIDFTQIEVTSNDKDVENETFVHNNKKIFLNIFKAVCEYSLDSKLTLKSTSNKFVVSDLANLFTISDADCKIFSIRERHTLFDKENVLHDISKLNCNYPKLRDLLQNGDNILKIYEHLRFYEEDFDKILLKKLT